MTEMEEKVVLVTGDTGFIGGHMYNFLSAQEDVTPVGYSTSRGLDILNNTKLEHYVKDAALVYHLAAFANPGRSKKCPKYTFNTNIQGTVNVLEACKKWKTSMVYVSSCEVYGNSTVPLSELSELKPTNPYAASKAAADRICYAYHECYDVDVKVVRLFNPYGPQQPRSKIITRFYEQASRGDDITVHGNGSDTRDYVYITDIINGLWLARTIPAGEVINLATGKKTTSLKIAKFIRVLTKSDSAIKCVAYPREHGGIFHQVGDYSRAMRYGWSPKADLADGIKMTLGVDTSLE